MCVCRQWTHFRVAHPSCCIVDVPISLTPISARPLPDSRVAKAMFSITHVGIKCERELQKVCVYIYLLSPCRRKTNHVAFWGVRHPTSSYVLVLSSLSVNAEMLQGQDRNESWAVCRNGASMVYYLYTTDDGSRIIV